MLLLGACVSTPGRGVPRHYAQDTVRAQCLRNPAYCATVSGGLDRVDQRDLTLSSTYQYNATGGGVHAYVIDTGIRATHADFGGRVSLDYSAVNDGNGASDCNGHGTHVASDSRCRLGRAIVA
jgi:subtilisin family serine protease